MDIEYDTNKDAANREKHGVSLSFGAEVFGDVDHVIVSSSRPIDGEDRFKVIGEVSGRLWTAVYVQREAATRFISVRKSNDGEQRYYRGNSG
ncbi:MAG: BrnT family toxin [Sphingobium sp.]|uniref:BrnT family toxin n=1 Tax=Sphingobium sp. TaxID=1912891 RepID=UPI0029B1F379|nr:BrnT family toxin [Sphingobium sp.]MDX3908884.1 BrnT family toxin [Sphingobium sp.]